MHWLPAGTLAAAGGAIMGALLADGTRADGWTWLHWIGKPLATVLIFLNACRAWPALSPRYRRWMLAGIACSLLGDVLLMLPQDLFVPGLLAFLVAHGCFIAALLDDCRFPASVPVLLAALAYGALNLGGLWSGIGPALRVPVIVYVLVLACMAGQAIGRARVLRGGSHRASAMQAGLGASMFLLSDTLLAWDRFHAPLPAAALWILGTYYPALWWIAGSVRAGGRGGQA